MLQAYTLTATEHKAMLLVPRFELGCFKPGFCLGSGSKPFSLTQKKCIIITGNYLGYAIKSENACNSLSCTVGPV
jgi:hypothetical protein